jgi:molybdopterin synthase catalytic subunit
MKEKKSKKSAFVSGPVSPGLIAEAIASHSSRKDIGAHSIFLGQVRKDTIDDKAVVAIEYTAYEAMAELAVHNIREAAFRQFPLTCLHVFHSLGRVPAGEISLFVFASSAHRQAAQEACTEVVNRIKKDVPVWGKEILEDESHAWKKNQ